MWLTVIEAVVVGRKAIGVEWLKYSLHVVSRYKFPATREPRSSSSSLSSSSSSLSTLPGAEAGSAVIYRRLDNAWTHVDDVACDCPKLVVGGTYLLAGWTHGRTGRGHGGLVLGRDSVVMSWRARWSRRLKRLARYEQRGRCWTVLSRHGDAKNGLFTECQFCGVIDHRGWGGNDPCWNYVGGVTLCFDPVWKVLFYLVYLYTNFYMNFVLNILSTKIRINYIMLFCKS